MIFVSDALWQPPMAEPLPDCDGEYDDEDMEPPMAEPLPPCDGEYDDDDMDVDEDEQQFREQALWRQLGVHFNLMNAELQLVVLQYVGNPLIWPRPESLRLRSLQLLDALIIEIAEARHVLQMCNMASYYFEDDVSPWEAWGHHAWHRSIQRQCIMRELLFAVPRR